MPTVSYNCPDTGKKMKKSFPYNAVGKAQADAAMRYNKGTISNNPGYGMETKSY